MVPGFARDRFTWLAYLMLAYYSYLQAALGPLVPFLRDELDLSYTVSGLHLSAFALGMVLAGFIADQLAARWGRQRVFWGGSLGMALGALLFAMGSHVALTIPAALVMGLPGTVLMIMVQSTLSDQHGANRAIALTESNVGASIGAGLAPLTVGTLARFGLGWRGALIGGALAWVALALAYRRVTVPPSAKDPEPEHPTPHTKRAIRTPLPRRYWAFWLVLFLCVSVEWSVVFWGADFLETNVGLSKVNASTLMTVFFVAMIIGRATGSRLSRRVAISRLLPGALAITAMGFLLFWLAPLAALNIAGLFVAGLGIANLFPLTLSAASSVVTPTQADRASGRIALAAGLAILITPQVLGALADQVGIAGAFAVVVVFLALALGAVRAANRSEM